VGKNILLEAVGKIYGRNAIEIGDTELFGNFNPWQKDRQFVVGNEVQGGADKRRVIELLKILVTSPEIQVNEKYKPQFTIPNVINFAFTSNNPDPFYLADTDRRFWVWEIQQSKPLPDDFYQRFHQWMESPEGIPALYYHLLHLDLSGFNPNACAPMTQSKLDMIDLSRTELETWVRELPENVENVIRNSGVGGYGTRPVTLFTAQDLLALWKADGPDGTKKKEGYAAMVKALRSAGFKQGYQGKQVRLKKLGRQRLWVVAAPQEATRLLEMTEPNELAEEYERQRAVTIPL
jgi:hypothetical protein